MWLRYEVVSGNPTTSIMGGDHDRGSMGHVRSHLAPALRAWEGASALFEAHAWPTPCLNPSLQEAMLLLVAPRGSYRLYRVRRYISIFVGDVLLAYFSLFVWYN